MICMGRLHLTMLLVMSTLISAGRAECGKYLERLPVQHPLRSRSHYDIDYTDRIVNGDQTAPHEFPWIALLLTRDMAYCGGSVINNYYVLTTAHCVVPYTMSKVKVVLGVHDRITMDYGEARVYSVRKAIVHPNHVDRRYYDENDVALLKLNEMITFDNVVNPVCLPYKDEDFTRRAAVVAGWGRKDEHGFTDRYLQEITVKILPDSECLLSKVQNLYSKLNDQVLCAYNRNSDSCQGDSGGPLVVNVDKNIMVQAGIISFGKLCGDRSSPGVYAKVAYHVDWILSVTKDAAYCKKPAYRPVKYDGLTDYEF